jgi:hypothetical protein
LEHCCTILLMLPYVYNFFGLWCVCRSRTFAVCTHVFRWLGIFLSAVNHHARIYAHTLFLLQKSLFALPN